MTIFDPDRATAQRGPGRRRSVFVAGARLRRVDAQRILDAVGLIAGRAASGHGYETRQELGRLEDLARTTLGWVQSTTGRAKTIGVEDGLDLAAQLLECADALAGGGWSVEAFALEGIEGRLLEALLDAGPLASGVAGENTR